MLTYGDLKPLFVIYFHYGYYYIMNKAYDVIIVGCGHAGSEAVLAAARIGLNCAVFCMDFSKAASMPCNPSIGGSAKGQIVGEIDAMGGIMGEAADHTYMQIKYLNSSRGPAVQALRTQNDKYEYPKYRLVARLRHRASDNA